MRKRSPSFEIQIDEQTIMYADIEVVGSIYNTDNISFIYYIEKSMEVDIWPVMPEAYRAFYIEKITDKYKQIQDDVRNFGKVV